MYIQNYLPVDISWVKKNAREVIEVIEVIAVVKRKRHKDGLDWKRMRPITMSMNLKNG